MSMCASSICAVFLLRGACRARAWAWLSPVILEPDMRWLGCAEVDMNSQAPHSTTRNGKSKKDQRTNELAALPFEFWFAKNGGAVKFPGLGHGKTRLPVLPELEQGGRKKNSEAMRRGHCPVLLVTKRKAKKRRRTHPRPQFAGGDPKAVVSKGELDSGRRKSARNREASGDNFETPAISCTVGKISPAQGLLEDESRYFPDERIGFGGWLPLQHTVVRSMLLKNFSCNF
ncbi:hypothetical protein B0H13DRAFT_1877762 [Mycena leptocephala]|nr:hypothetical protein B0H13DRAFT_1877762 [Mycena leptocephala]